ncbi:MAG: hypothetical protein AAF989_07765 [Planctomycetota bacterium]
MSRPEPESASSFCGVEIDALLDEFYGSPLSHSQLGDFTEEKFVPPPFDKLLDHNEHMTVTVEAHLGESVDVEVHRCHVKSGWYSREILLTGSKSGQIVQYGIVRLKIDELAPEVWRKIEDQSTPLGRVLIENRVLREVQLCKLWKVVVGPCLSTLMRIPIGQTIHGRTALIRCDGQPAIELLEIVSG